jgi:hypothetical protein
MRGFLKILASVQSLQLTDQGKESRCQGMGKISDNFRLKHSQKEKKSQKEGMER